MDIKVDSKGLTLDELWEVWEEVTKAALGAVEVGKIVSLYKVSGQRPKIGILDVESTDELDQIIMSGLPRAEYLAFEQVLPVREYASFAEDIRRRWE